MTSITLRAEADLGMGLEGKMEMWSGGVGWKVKEGLRRGKSTSDGLGCSRDGFEQA